MGYVERNCPKCGAKVRENCSARFMEESQKRMQDRDYVEKLVAYGYSVPDTYRGRR